MQFFKIPQNDQQLIWTKHVIEKMKYYQLSESCLKKLLRSYARRETGIAMDTIALMMPAGSKRQTEIWLMYQKEKGKIKIITAWRYPGVSPKKEIPLPEEIRRDLNI